MTSVESLDPVVQLRGVAREYVRGPEVVVAVADVTLSVGAGAFLLLRGPSGSGKSTLLNIISGLDRPTSGTAVVCGMDLGQKSESELTRHRLLTTGVIFQDDNLLSEFTARENVMLPLRAAGMTKSEAQAEADRQLARVDIGQLHGRLPGELSAGQRQRVGIARGLAGGKQLLVADEPTGALDSSNASALYRLLRSLADEGTTVVMASHDPAAAQWCTASVTLQDGMIIDSRTA